MLFTRKPKWIAFVFVIFFSVFHLLSFSQETIYGKGWTIVDRSGRIYATALDYFDIQEFHKGAAKAQVPGGFCLIDMNIKEVTNRLRGPNGSDVEVTVERDGRHIDLSITRERIDADKLVGETEE